MTPSPAGDPEAGMTQAQTFYNRLLDATFVANRLRAQYDGAEFLPPSFAPARSRRHLRGHREVDHVAHLRRALGVDEVDALQVEHKRTDVAADEAPNAVLERLGGAAGGGGRAPAPGPAGRPGGSGGRVPSP